ncbi:WD40-repeat-containing domain protein [Schizophyllum commune]
MSPHLEESPALQHIPRPECSASIASEAYIMSITALPSRYAIAPSAPSTSIDVLDSASLRFVQSFPGHEGGVSALRTIRSVAGLTRPALVSSGRDGSVKVWDERSNAHSIKMTDLGKSRAILSVDVSPDGLTVAGGTDLQGEDATILYWDSRQPAAPLRAHSSTHSDDITALHFSPFDPSGRTLLSASSDGLLSVSNAAEDDEDEAVVHVANWGCSISQAGWVGAGGAKGAIWAASDMETFSTWSGELDRYSSLDIKIPAVQRIDRPWVTDYLITSHSTGDPEHPLAVFVGSNEGDIALISERPSTTPSSSPSWTLHKKWLNGHAGVVRSLLWDESNSVIVTGGEDSKLNVWSLEGPTVDDGDDAMELDDGADAANHTHDASYRGRKRGASWDDGDEMVS